MAQRKAKLTARTMAASCSLMPSVWLGKALPGSPAMAETPGTPGTFMVDTATRRDDHIDWHEKDPLDDREIIIGFYGKYGDPWRREGPWICPSANRGVGDGTGSFNTSGSRAFLLCIPYDQTTIIPPFNSRLNLCGASKSTVVLRLFTLPEPVSTKN